MILNLLHQHAFIFLQYYFSSVLLLLPESFLIARPPIYASILYIYIYIYPSPSNYDLLNHFLLQALQQLREKALRRAKLTEDQILKKIEERTVARKDKDYEKSDAIRKDLAALGIALMDSPDGTNWRPAIPLALQEQQVAST